MEQANITIYATDETAQKFLLFQKYYDVFSTMVDNGVFNQKNGAITLHFDEIGTLRLIQRADNLYMRKKGT